MAVGKEADAGSDFGIDAILDKIDPNSSLVAGVAGSVNHAAAQVRAEAGSTPRSTGDKARKAIEGPSVPVKHGPPVDIFIG